MTPTSASQMSIIIHSDDKNRVCLSLHCGHTVVTWHEERSVPLLQTLSVLNRDYYRIFFRI